MPRFSSAAFSNAPAGASSWRSISVSSRCTTVTSMPRSARPCAASRPSNPPPMTTARRFAPEASSMRFTSSRSRNVTTPGRSLPGSGSMIGSEPVASSSRS